MSACDRDVFEKGAMICTIDGWADDIEPWVQKLAARSGQRVDWHYQNGRARVLFVGNYEAVRQAVDALAPELVGRVIRIVPPPRVHSPVGTEETAEREHVAARG